MVGDVARVSDLTSCHGGWLIVSRADIYMTSALDWALYINQSLEIGVKYQVPAPPRRLTPSEH